MRPHNSVGGYRVYPTSPADAETANAEVAILGQFNEGMDRLNTERQLTDQEQYLVDHLDHRSELANKYQRLLVTSNTIWGLALEKQQAHGRNEFDPGELTTEDLVVVLNDYANRWRAFKREIAEQA